MSTLTAPCNEDRRAPLITWRLRDYHLGRDLIIITPAPERYHWMLDLPDAGLSPPQPDYVRCLTAARIALGLPLIGESRVSITP